jgi:AraC-like DNA-binding protein
MTAEESIHATSFRVGSSIALPVVVRSLGHSPEIVFAAAGVDLELYRHPENRIAAEKLGKLFMGAAELTHRADIGLLVASGFKPGALGLVGEVAAEGPDVNTALKNLVRLLPHNTLAGYPVLSVSDTTAALKFELRVSDFPGAEFILEGAIGIGFRFLQWLCGERWKPEEVHLSRRKPKEARPFQEFFGAPIRFSATEDALVFSAEWLAHRVAREQDRLSAGRLDIADASFTELVRRQVTMDLGFGPLNAEQLARRLGVSRRQLFRHLQDEGTTCQAIVDDVKFARARHLLAAGDAPIAEIAIAMGFPDQSSFTRAFSRWSGMAPLKWRKRHR